MSEIDNDDDVTHTIPYYYDFTIAPGLTHKRVSSYGEVQALLDGGNKLRITAATGMNENSSRYNIQSNFGLNHILNEI